METKEQYLLEAKNLSKYFPVKNFFGNWYRKYGRWIV
mgnify:CR=1 FL=1